MRKKSMLSTLSSFTRSGTKLLRMTSRLMGTVTALPKVRPSPKPKRAAKAGVAAPAARAGFSPNPGGLTMQLHVPARLTARPPLVVLMHGCGQDPQAFAVETGWRARADKAGFVLLMPGQVEANNAQRCFNWFRPGDIGRDLGEAGSIAAQVRSVVKRHRCDPARVFVTGLSAGGAMTAALLASYPDLFAGGAVVAGLPAGSASGVIGAMTRMAGRGAELPPADWMARARALGPVGYAGPWPRLAIWHGDADKVVAPVNGAQLAAQWVTLLGLENPAVRREVAPGVTCDSWGAAGGDASVQLWQLAGMGHVYPTAAAAEIAAFWKL